MTAQVTILTPTYAKPELFAQCAESVLAQTYQDWLWWVVINRDTWPLGYWRMQFGDPRIVPIWYTTADHGRVHVTAQVVNWIYPKVTTPYIYFLADDDLIDPKGLRYLVSAMNVLEDYEEFGLHYQRNRQAVYGRCEVQNEQPDGTFTTGCWCYEGTDVGLGTGIEPDCRLDSSQILHTKALWDKATADGWQLTDSLEEAAHADGILLNRLAEFATFHYVSPEDCDAPPHEAKRMAQTPTLRLEKMTGHGEMGSIKSDDYNFTYTLRNTNARFFFYGKTVSPDQHWRWIQQTVARKDFDFYIIWSGEDRAGTIAVEHCKDCEFLQNLCIAEPYRGKGLAKWAITQLMKPNRFIIAQVKPDNKQVIKMYQELGFWKVKR